MNKNEALITIPCILLMFLCFADVRIVLAASNDSNTWITKAPLPQGIAYCKSAVVDGKIYVLGESNNYVYDPSLDYWAALTPMPTPRIDFGVAVYEHTIFVIGGQIGNNFSSANEAYNTLNDTWETMAPMPTERSEIQASMVNGKIYVMGGINYAGYVALLNALPMNEVYDISNNSWSTKQPMPYPVYSYACAVLTNKIYFMGGTNHTVPTSLTQIYDTQNDSWSFGADMPTAVLGAAAGATGALAPERIYVMGGAPYAVIDLQGLNANQVYDPENNSWSLAAPMPTGRIYFTVANVNDNLFAIGGYQGFTYSYFTNNEVYIPIGYGTPDPSYILATTPPTIYLLSPGGAYNVSSVPLCFTINKLFAWAGYSLDGKGNVSVIGNYTLTNLSNGSHSITVYANDTFGNMGASETVYFSIDAPEPFPTAPVATASVATVSVVVGVSLIVYFKKRKNSS
jgi:N-acetylneuraminic acid mutarotase